jgi:hypothetical protein
VRVRTESEKRPSDVLRREFSSDPFPLAARAEKATHSIGPSAALNCNASFLSVTFDSAEATT